MTQQFEQPQTSAGLGKQDKSIPGSQSERIHFNPYNGYLSDAISTLNENGLPHFSLRISETLVDEPAPFSDEEISKIEALLEPRHQFSNFLEQYATARWGGDTAHAEWKGKDGWRRENIAAKFWWQLTPEERKNFYLRMTREEAETYWNSKKVGVSEPKIRIIVEKYPKPEPR